MAISGIEDNIIKNVLSGLGDMKAFNAIVKRETDIANKRLNRMNKFQKNLFEDKGITHISRAGDVKAKLKALSNARIVNESGISTKREYNRYANQLAKDLSLSRKEVDYMLDSFDNNTRDFVSTSTLKYGSNPQIDFLYEDVIEVNNALTENLKRANLFNQEISGLLNELQNI